MKNYIKIARPDHWIKNMFILPGIIMGIMMFGTDELFPSLFNIVLGTIATCLIASANYVINEWLDAEFDKFHPIKKNRPVVVANLRFELVMLEYALLVIAGLGLSLLINMPFFWVEVLLLIMGALYNIKPVRTKDVPYLDVISESFNNVIRLLLGWFMINESHMPPISVMVAYWLCGAYLMNVKRYSEYRMINNSELAGLYRKSFKYYTENRLLAISLFYGMSAIVALALFIVKYRMEYMIALPFVVALFVYYFMLSYKEDSVVQKPEKLYKEKYLFILILLIMIVLLILTFVDIDVLHVYHYPVELE